MESNFKTTYAKQWITLGAISGITANIVYPVLLAVPLPGFLEIVLGGMFGILISLSGFAIHSLLSYKKPSVLSRIGALFIFTAGVILNMMIVIQLTFLGYLGKFQAEMTGANDAHLLEVIRKTVNPVHLALDISADFFLGLGTLLFAIVMWKHLHFGKIWSLLGAILALILLAVKFYAFPFTPYELGLPYIFGPLLAVWYLAVCIQCLRKRNALSI